ncbi:MAG: response regulator, partial [Flammeovirgaceae bacterium]
MDYSILKKKTVLIADDEAIILKVASQFFLYYGCDVISAPNGKVAIELAEKKQPDLIIMDWQMPIMNGLEATKKIKSNPPTKHIPVIIATGASDSNDHLQQALANGADDYLTKPLEEKVMIARAVAVLRLYQTISLVEQQNQALLKANAQMERYKRGLKSFKFITSDSNLELDKQLEKAMGFMLRYYDMELGIISQITEKEHRVINMYGPRGLKEGFSDKTIDLNRSICKAAYESEKVVIHEDLPSEITFKPALAPDAQSYIGISIWIKHIKYGSVCFISNQKKLGFFHQDDIEFMQLFARWLGYAIERSWHTKDLIQTNRSKDRILATVAHDLRNPIQAIQGVATILKLQLKEASPSDLEVISLIDSSCKKALHLIAELLESSEMENTSYKLRKSPTAIDIFIHRTLKSFEQRIQEKQQQLKLDLNC